VCFLLGLLWLQVPVSLCSNRLHISRSAYFCNDKLLCQMGNFTKSSLAFHVCKIMEDDKFASAILKLDSCLQKAWAQNTQTVISYLESA